MEQEDSEAFNDYTMAFKLLITNTDSLSTPKATKLIKQIFADYHVKLKKPNRSISNHFDSSTPFARMLNDLLEVETNFGTLKSRIALHGNISQGKLWKFDQYKSLVQKFLGVTPAAANSTFAKQVNYDNALKVCTKFLVALVNALPVSTLDDENFLEIHESSMFTKVIFSNAFGLVGKSMLEMQLTGAGGEFEKLNNFTHPINSKSDKIWLKRKVTFDDEGTNKIIKNTEKRVGGLLCNHLGVLPCDQLVA